MCVFACSPSTSSSDLGAAAVDLAAMLTQIITAHHAQDVGGARRTRQAAAAAGPAAGQQKSSTEKPARGTPGRSDSRRNASLTGRRAAQMLHCAAGGSLEVDSPGSSSETDTAEELQQLDTDDDGGLEDAAASSSSSRLPGPEMPPIEEVEHVLASANDWQFDAFALAEATNGHPLSALAFFLFSKQGLIDQFKLKPTALARFLRRVESGYKTNPYHNATHASDVLQTMHCILTRGGLMPGYVDPMHLMACYTAAVSLPRSAKSRVVSRLPIKSFSHR